MMTTRSITATQLASNFSDLLNQVHYQHVTLEIMRDNEPIAYVSPAPAGVGYPIDQLDCLLESLPRLSAEEARLFLDDIHCVVAIQPVGTDAWAS